MAIIYSYPAVSGTPLGTDILIGTTTAVVNGKIEIRRIMNLSSSFDHRVIDGADGAALIQHLKRMLEHPAMIFM